MAFQTNVLRDGQWVTETVDLQAALRASAAEKAAAIPGPEPPVCGVLTKTIVESPITRWILPVRLRSKSHKDVAFIGDHFVQISELRKDGQIHEVLRHPGFGHRIRSAVVIGTGTHGLVDDDDDAGVVKSEHDVDTDMRDSPQHADDQTALAADSPPQMLALMLETGDCIFLFVRTSADSKLEFVTSKYALPKTIHYIGHHLAVDPSSRYLAASTPEGVLVVYEMHSWSTIHEQLRRDGSFSPIKSTRVRMINGVIHKMDFLFPRPEDDYHIILLLIVVRRERRLADPVARMVTYEWELGDGLKSVLAEDKSGNRLPNEHRMPMLMIPLKFKNAFFVVSDANIGVVKYALSGTPVFERLAYDTPARTALHHGAEEPFWTAWARPFRRRSYFEKTDIILLAREDGAIIHVEIDEAELVPSVINVGCLDTNINTAFTTSYDRFSDVLVIGGDSGPGSIWKLAPRTDLEQVSVIPNWSPVVDIATTYEHTVASSSAGKAGRGKTNPPATLRKPDSIFTASGRGLKGSVTQWRWGIQARIGLDIESGEPIRQAWVFPIKTQDSTALLGLLALPHSSLVLQFAKDFGQVQAVPAEETELDLSTRTLFAAQCAPDQIIQITESFMAVASHEKSFKQSIEDILNKPAARADKAYYLPGVVILSILEGESSQLHALKHADGEFSPVSKWTVEGEITAVCLCRVSGRHCAVVASSTDAQPVVSLFSLDGDLLVQERVHGAQSPGEQQSSSNDAAHLEPVTTICVVNDESEAPVLVVGTRCGHLATVSVSEHTIKRMVWHVEGLGISPVEVFPPPSGFSGGMSAFVCCDNNLIMLSDFSDKHGYFQKKHTVLPTDSNDHSMPSPPIHSICSLDESLSGYDGHISLLMLAGSRILMTDIWPRVAHVPRAIPIEGTPTRIIFSHTWNCLVVALLKDDKTTLDFIDADTGLSISDPSDKDKNPSEFISGLGHAGDRIYGLHEWLYVKDGRTFSFILVTTKDGRLLIVSLKEMESSPTEGSGRKLKYWTRYKKWLGKPIYSVVGDDDGLIFCAERTLHWEVLDLADKKLKPMKEYQLDSPATSLRVENGKIFALTTMNSLEVIDHRTSFGSDMALLHTDQISRRTVHMVDVGNQGATSNQWPVMLLSDYRRGFAGVWVPFGQDNKELQCVFEGELPTSVRRFAKVRSRPPWVTATRTRRYGTIPNSPDGAEVVGVALDGALLHFTLLGIELWRFLCLIQNLAQRSKAMRPLVSQSSSESEDDEMDLEPQIHPKMMHVDGDLLGRCLEQHTLEKVVGDGDGLDLFCEYLDGLEGGRCTAEFCDATDDGERRERYFEAAYNVLDYLFSPVL